MQTRRQYLGLVFAWLAALSLPALARSQRTDVLSPCDPTLERRPGDPLAYAMRGERCEGLYIREVAGNAGLLLASFGERHQLTEFTPGQPLRVEWSPPAGAVVRLRAVALRRRLYYRMDAVRGGGSRFDWPVDVLSTLRLDASEVGVVAWFERRIAARVEAVYLPLRLGAAATPVPATGRYVATLVPGSELSTVFVSLAAIDADGREVRVLQRDERLQQGPYPAGRAVRIVLPPLPRGGLYRLNVGGVLVGGAPTYRTIVFLHPDQPA